jgi:hypothetical protein
MWNMHAGGVGVLRGPLRKLFVKGVVHAAYYFLEDGGISDEIVDGNITPAGADYNAAYDRLEAGEKAFALAEVARALTSKSDPPLQTQWSEATIYAVFETIAAAVAGEIDLCDEDDLFARSPYSHEWRSLVADAERQVRELIDDEDEYIDVASVDQSEWNSVVLECLSEEILWDLDFLDNDIPDLPPRASSEAHSFFGIHGEYYTATVPVVSEKELKEAERFLRKLSKTI